MAQGLEKIKAEKRMAETVPGRMNSDGKSSNCSDAKTVWDCESRLYDSFELRAFTQQLSVAMAAVTTLKSYSPHHMRSPLYQTGCLANLPLSRRKRPRAERQVRSVGKIRGGYNRQQTEIADRLTVWTKTDPENARRAENFVSRDRFEDEREPENRKKRQGTRFPRLLQKLFKPFLTRP